MSAPLRAVLVGLAIGMTTFAVLVLRPADEPSAQAQRPFPTLTPAAILASCADTLDNGAGAFNLTHVEVSSSEGLTTWHFRYDGPNPNAVQWSSTNKEFGTEHLLAFDPAGQVTKFLVRDLRTGGTKEAGVPVTYGASPRQPSHVQMSFPRAMVDPRSLKGAVAAVTVPGGRTDTCVLR